jgi:hypothetical protein
MKNVTVLYIYIFFMTAQELKILILNNTYSVFQFFSGCFWLIRIVGIDGSLFLNLVFKLKNIQIIL